MPRWGGVKQNKSEIRKANMTSNLNWVFGTGFTDKRHLYKDLKWVELQHRAGQVDNTHPWEVPYKWLQWELYTEPCRQGMGMEMLFQAKGQPVPRPRDGLCLVCFKSNKGVDKAEYRGRLVDEKSQTYTVWLIGSYKEYRILYSLSYRILQAPLSTSSSEESKEHLEDFKTCMM